MRVSVVATFVQMRALLLVFVACGGQITAPAPDATTDGPAIVEASTDVSVIEAGADVAWPVLPCQPCGSIGPGVGDNRCKTDFDCQNAHTTPSYECNNTAYEVSCDCEAGTCACSLNGKVYKTLVIPGCTCSVNQFPPTPPAAMQGCGVQY